MAEERRKGFPERKETEGGEEEEYAGEEHSIHEQGRGEITKQALFHQNIHYCYNRGSRL